MAKTVPIIGIEPSELPWIRMLVALLRHPDPSVADLSRHALVYLTDGAGRSAIAPAGAIDHLG
ncbi:MAG: hypothetical protein LAP87_12805 [Acidobacteriia bacterium]|nr:hypothetical protein [Terriglobia bacterium]